jgi:hypothetical protein
MKGAKRARPRLDAEPVGVKAFYTLTELCVLTGLSRVRVKRLVRTCDLELMSWGRSIYVPLSELREKLEPLWREICEVQRAREEDLD